MSTSTCWCSMASTLWTKGAASAFTRHSLPATPKWPALRRASPAASKRCSNAGPRCVSISGISVHANVCVPAHDRMRLERLCRYAARPPVATERLSLLADARLLYRLKRGWRDGTTHVIFQPLELLEKLAALVPPPRFNLVRYYVAR